MPRVGAPEGRTRGAAWPFALLRATVPGARWLQYSARWQPERGGLQCKPELGMNPLRHFQLRFFKRFDHSVAVLAYSGQYAPALAPIAAMTRPAGLPLSTRVTANEVRLFTPEAIALHASSPKAMRSASVHAVASTLFLTELTNRSSLVRDDCVAGAFSMTGPVSASGALPALAHPAHAITDRSASTTSCPRMRNGR